MNKQEIRRKIRADRESLPEQVWHSASSMICMRIEELPVYRNAAVICAYMAEYGEVLLDELIEDAWKQGKRTGVPRVDEQSLSFREITSMDQLAEGYRGIREPDAGSLIIDDCDALILVPSVALDVHLHRLGHGGGFYDRYLSEARGLVKLAPAFDFQIFSEIPADEWDVRMDAIVTETRTFGCI